YQVPYVALEPVSAPAAKVPSVAVANRAGAMTATVHLISLGHERIAIITGWLGSLCGQDRLDGYRAAMAAAGFRVPPQYVVHGDFGLDGGCGAMHQLLDLPQPPTAVFASSDL